MNLNDVNKIILNFNEANKIYFGKNIGKNDLN